MQLLHQSKVVRIMHPGLLKNEGFYTHTEDKKERISHFFCILKGSFFNFTFYETAFHGQVQI